MKRLIFFIFLLVVCSQVSANIFTGISQNPAEDVFTNLYFKTTSKIQWRIYLTPTGERYALQTFASGRIVKHPLNKNLHLIN